MGAHKQEVLQLKGEIKFLRQQVDAAIAHNKCPFKKRHAEESQNDGKIMDFLDEYAVKESSSQRVSVPVDNPDENNDLYSMVTIALLAIKASAAVDKNAPFVGQVRSPYGETNSSGLIKERKEQVMHYIELQKQALALYVLLSEQLERSRSVDNDKVEEIMEHLVEFKSAAVEFMCAKGWDKKEIYFDWGDIVHLLLTLMGFNMDFVNCTDGSPCNRVTPINSEMRKRMWYEVNPVLSCLDQNDASYILRYPWGAEICGPDIMLFLALKNSKGDYVEKGYSYSVQIQTAACWWVMSHLIVRYENYIFITNVGRTINGTYTLCHPNRQEPVFLTISNQLVVSSNGGIQNGDGILFEGVAYQRVQPPKTERVIA